MNKAFAAGADRHDWWPDWRGQVCVVVGSGPSTSEIAVQKFKGIAKFVAIKENYNICKWADAVYGCDAHWWAYRRGLPEFRGLKFSYDKVEYFGKDIKKVELDKTSADVLIDVPLLLGSGGNSGHQAINLAVQFGAKRLVLIGFDFQVRSGKPHWYGRSTWPGCHNPGGDNCDRWLRAMTWAAKALRRMKIDVVNCSPLTAIKEFPVMRPDDVIDAWKLREDARAAV